MPKLQTDRAVRDDAPGRLTLLGRIDGAACEGKLNRLGENRTSPEALESIIARATGAVPVYPTP